MTPTNEHSQNTKLNKDCSVVIPVYNSEGTLAQLIRRLADTLPKICNTYEVILVNDGSRDGSWSEIEKLGAQYPFITAVNLMRNFGQHNALLCGIRLAHHTTTVTMDDDLQHPPEEIGKLLNALTDEIDVVYGIPQKQEHSLWRVAASVVVKWALKVAMRVDVARDVQPFRAFRTDLRLAFADHSATEVSIDVLLTWGTSKFGRVHVDHNPRSVGKSNYSFSKLLNHAFNMITGYSSAPLRAASVLGFILTLFGALVLISTIFSHFLLGGAPPGFAFLASVISLFSGAQLFFLGLIGEYLGRVHNRTMDRPPYVIRQITHYSSSEGSQQ